MATEKMKIASTLYRSFQLRKEAINEENRTCDMSFSSEHPVRRGETPQGVYNEILDHNPKSMILNRMNAGAPLLMGHDPKDQVGIVEPGSAKCDGKTGRCIVRFSRSKRGEEMFQDVKDGIRGAVSVGYQVHAMDDDDDNPEDDDGVPNLRATRWEPMEVSLESLPADPTVGAGRSQAQTQVEIPVTRKEKSMITTRNLAPTATDGGGSALTEEIMNQRMADASAKDKSRRKEIRALAKQYSKPGLDLSEDALAFIDDDKTAEAFTRHILDKRGGVQPIKGSPIAEPLGMNSRELNQYSICKAIMDIQRGGLEGIEKEAHDASLKRYSHTPEGKNSFIIPEDVLHAKFRGEGWNRGAVTRDMMTRDMQASIFTQGGATVQTDVLGSSLIELLRNKIQCVNSGARTMNGLSGNVAIPRQTAGATAYDLGEITQVTESDQALNQLLLTPHRLGVSTNYSNLLLQQSTLDAESFVRSDLTKVSGIAIDQRGISGAGGAQPVGILNTTGIGVQTVTAGAPTYAQMVGFETTVAAANADFGSLGWQFSTASRGLLKTIARNLTGATTVSSVALWEGSGRAEEGTVNGYRALATNQLNTALNGDKAIFANWEDMLFAFWGGVQVMVNPYSLDREGEVRITMFYLYDIGIRHAGSFCISNGSVI